MINLNHTGNVLTSASLQCAELIKLLGLPGGPGIYYSEIVLRVSQKETTVSTVRPVYVNDVGIVETIVETYVIDTQEGDHRHPADWITGFFGIEGQFRIVTLELTIAAGEIPVLCLKTELGCDDAPYPEAAHNKLVAVKR